MSKPFRIKRSVDNQFYFTIVGKNNRVIVVSETMKQKQSVLKSIYSICNMIASNNVDGNLNSDDLIQDETLKK